MRYVPTVPSSRHALLVAGLVLTLLACAGEDGGQTADDDGLVDAYRSAVDTVVADQEAADVPVTPLGRLLDDCIIADADARAAIGDGLGIDQGQAGEVLNVTLTDPDGPQPVVSCAIRYGEASAGAVIIAAGLTESTAEDVRAELVAQSFVEVDDATADGLPEDRVLLFDATTFEASRAIWVGEGLQVAITANSDLAGRGALLDALPVAVDEVGRTLR